MTNQTFTHVGVSRLNGALKARFANDALRVKVLAKGGHTDINLVELVKPMSKVEAIEYLISIDFAKGNAEVTQALEDALDRRAPKAGNKDAPKKETKKPKKEKPKAKDITLDSIMAKAMKPSVTKAEVQKQLDDAPF
jgi:hypothetical protein